MKGTIPNKKVRPGNKPTAGREERLGAIAHDLNNVLSPILMAVSLLRPRLPDERGARILTLVADNAKRGAELVRQIQDILAHGEGGRGPRRVGGKGEAARPAGKARRHGGPARTGSRP
jgi:signal transduction histidine kinase